MSQAEQAGLPLPASYSTITTMLAEIADAGSRIKRMRAMLLHGADLKAAASDLAKLDTFITHAGLAQYSRSRRLLDAAVVAGLEADETWGPTITDAGAQMNAIIDQRPVLDDWDGAYREQRELLIGLVIAPQTVHSFTRESSAGWVARSIRLQCYVWAAIPG